MLFTIFKDNVVWAKRERNTSSVTMWCPQFSFRKVSLHCAIIFQANFTASDALLALQCTEVCLKWGVQYRNSYTGVRRLEFAPQCHSFCNICSVSLYCQSKLLPKVPLDCFIPDLENVCVLHAAMEHPSSQHKTERVQFRVPLSSEILASDALDAVQSAWPKHCFCPGVWNGCWVLGAGKQIRPVNRLWVACDFEMPALPLSGLD